MSGARRRLARLEDRAREELPARWSYEEWPAEDQLAAVADKADFHAAFGTVAECTDREINLLAVLAAYRELDGPGEWVAPSGAAVYVEENVDGTFRFRLSTNAAPEDLPEGMREHVERMDPRRQEKREEWLFENRYGFEPWREKVRRVEEEHRAYAKASKQRDRELLEGNRAAVGLPPLTPEQITKLELGGTTWEGGASVHAQ